VGDQWQSLERDQYQRNIGFVRSNSWRLKSTYCILRLCHPQKCKFKRLGNVTLTHYTTSMIFLNSAFSSSLDQCDKNYFSLMSQFWVYFMAISLIHNLYFMNSAQWKTSILLPISSCIYLHNWLADGFFLFKLQVCNWAEHSVMLVTVNTRSQQWILL